jgi:hypothetical protein
MSSRPSSSGADESSAAAPASSPCAAGSSCATRTRAARQRESVTSTIAPRRLNFLAISSLTTAVPCEGQRGPARGPVRRGGRREAEAPSGDMVREKRGE